MSATVEKKLDNPEEISQNSSISTQKEESINEPSKTEKQCVNILSIQLGQIDKLPPTWIPPEDQNVSDHIFEYEIWFEFPVDKENKQEFFIKGGRLCSDKKVIEKPPEEKKVARAKSPAKTKKPKKDETQNDEPQEPPPKYWISWEENILKINMNEDALNAFDEMCTKGINFKVNFQRKIREDKFQEGWEDENAEKYKGQFEFSLQSLLIPGAKQISNTYEIKPLAAPVQEEEQDKKGGKSKPATQKKAPKKKPKKGVPIELCEEGEDEVHPYIAQGTCVQFTLTLNSPIIPLPQDRLKTKIKPGDLIPKRKKTVKKIDATEKYQKEVEAIVNLLVDEYMKQSRGGKKVIREKFIYELNNSGVYFTLKEKLQQTVIEIVKEKFAKEVSNPDPREKERFCNDLYVYLVQQAHIKLNQMFAASREREFEILGVDGVPTDKWKRLADEAEVQFNYELAAKYHQERVALDTHNPELWYEYALFNLRGCDWEKAEQALREAIAVDLAHTKSLLAYGMLLSSKEKYKEAEVFLQSVVDIESQNMLAWFLLGLYYEFSKNEKLARQTFVQADFVLKQENKTLQSARTEYASYLLDLNLCSLAEKILLQEAAENPSTNVQQCLARLYFLQKKYDEAEKILKEIVKTEIKSEKAWTLLGNVYYMQNKIEDAEKAFGNAVSFAGSQDPVTLLRLGELYIRLQKYEDAKNAYLNATKVWPCCTSWLGVGVAYYKLQEYALSEQALNEANIQNNTDARVWAYLAMICIRDNRIQEAEKALREAHRQKLRDIDLIKELIQLFSEKGKKEEVAELQQLLSKLQQ